MGIERSTDVTAERVLIVADDLLTRAGLAALLSDQADCTVVGQVAAEAAMSEVLEVYRPDVLVWDLGWDPTVTLERLADLPDDGPPVVVLLSDETQAVEGWFAGARGLLLRDADPTRLVVVIKAVAQGVVVFDPQLAAAMVSARDRAPIPPTGGLTPRDLQVLRLLAEGLPNKSIADQLNISEHTVKFHVNAILGKLGAQSRTEAVTKGTRLGLIPL